MNKPMLCNWRVSFLDPPYAANSMIAHGIRRLYADLGVPADALISCPLPRSVNYLTFDEISALRLPR